MSKRTKWLSLIGVIAALVIGWQIAAFAGPVGLASGFQDDDGNLTPNTPNVSGTLDWNSFAPPNWTGTPPPTPFPPNYRTTDVTDTGGWDFFGMLDEFKGSGNNNADSIYAGGTKQSDNCPTLVTKSAPNKDDIKRVYFATKTLEGGTKDGHLILNLAWVRIPLNSTQSSAHLSFEFNQSETPCPGSGHTDPVGRSLVPRTGDGARDGVDDLLIQYDFEGGNTVPTISISRWTGTAWTTPVTLPAGVAEALVNQAPLTNLSNNNPPGPDNRDALAPPGPNTPADVGALEFGEAGIDLTAAGVFQEGECVNFGRVSASSRSSGNSNTSNMFDIVGPDEFSLENCGGVIIRKETDPTPDATDTTFDYTTTGGLESGDPGFSLKDQESKDFGAELQAGSYSVTEDLNKADTDGFALSAIDCSASDLANGSTVDPDPDTGTVDIVLEAQDQVDCTYTNTLQKGALAIEKDSTKGGAVSNPGALFTFDGQTVRDNDDPTAGTVSDEDPDPGEVCVSGQDLGDYTVNETEPPPGYGPAPADQADQLVTVVNNTDCTEAGYPTTAVANFTNAPLSDIQVRFRDGGSGETALTGGEITCDNATGDTDNDATADWDDTETISGVEIDPSPQTITCTIEIDP